jgi:hypothetical protein
MQMKKFLLLTVIVFTALFIQAQNYEPIKNMMVLQKNKEARAELDKSMANAKFAAKPEAYILKAAIYAGLANENGTKGTPAADLLIADAEAAFAKYKEMDPQMSLLSDPIYQNAPINIYSALFSSGYKDYETKNWQAGFQKFKKVVDYSDMLIAKKILPVPADTNSLLLAGITSESAGLKDEAVKYYGRMADLRVTGQGYEGIYRYLVNYYAGKKDDANFEKYKTIGKSLYPNSEFFTYDKVDFAVGLEEDFNKKIEALETTAAADPGNAKPVQLIGELIYDTLNSAKEGAVPPANATALEAKMFKAFNKLTGFKPNDEYAYLLMGGHYINKRDKLDELRQKHVNDMKARTKPGTAASKEDIAKRDTLDAQYARAFLAIEGPYAKAAEIYSKKPQPMTAIDIQRYKNVAGYLGDIATYKKNKAKANPADLAKYTADEKKWNDLYDEISKMKPKPRGGDCNDVKIGMSRDEVIKIMGNPNSISKTTVASGIQELLIYDKCSINISAKGAVDYINEIK